MTMKINEELEVSKEAYQEIEAIINSNESPVGIDAKKTHILILHKLVEIEKRIAHLEQRLDAQDANQ